MCGGKPKTLIMSLNYQRLKERYPRNDNLYGNKLRAHLRAKFKADPESLDVREAREMLKWQLDDALGPVRKKKKLKKLTTENGRLNRQNADMKETIQEQEHEENLVKTIERLDADREDLRDERDILCKALIAAYTRPVYEDWKQRYKRFRANPKFKEQEDEVLELLIQYDNRQKKGACTKIILTDRKEIAKARAARMKEHLAFGNPVYENKETK